MMKISQIFFMNFQENIKTIVVKLCIVILSLCSLIWLSIFSYGIIYYLYIPAVAHINTVHLRYDMSCVRGSLTLCKHPFDNITLIKEGEYEFLRGGQGYAIEIVLEMPESDRNLNQGMFMIKLDMLDRSGTLIQTSHRSALLRYRSPLFKLVYTVFFMPGLLAGSVEEKQSLMIPLFEKYVENSNRPTHFAHLEIQAQFAEVYSSLLQIHAQFTGLRYLMYYWPITSAVVGIGGHFLFMLTTILMIWLRETMKAENDTQESLPQSAVKHEVKKQTKRHQFHKHPSGISRDRTPEKKIGLPIRTKTEIESLSAHSSKVQKHPEKCTTKMAEEDANEEYFDVDSVDLPSTSQSTMGEPYDIESGALRKRIKQILGKKDLN